LKAHFELTLTDRSEAMSAVSRAVNPECEHRSGDMRSLRLDREFDLVLIHDAIMYLTDPDSVRAALATAALHCRIGGGLALLPDCVRESFTPKTSTGGEDGPDGRALRYLEWRFDRDPRDQVFEVAFAFLLREGDAIRVERDHHTFGLFSREEWFGWIREAGFAPESRIDPWRREVFIGRRR
jgi:trans-aconitate methyltransferase